MTCLGMTGGPLIGGVMASYLGYRWSFVFISVVLIVVVFPVASRVRTSVKAAHGGAAESR